MTQAPTPGPLTSGWKQAKGSNPFPHGDNTPIRVRRDGEEWDATASTFNWDLWVEWKPLAPTAPVEASGSEREDEDAIEVEDMEWPESPLANDLYQHIQSQFCLHPDEAAEETGEVLSILAKHGVDPTKLPLTLSTTPARAEAQDEGAAGEAVAKVVRKGFSTGSISWTKFGQDADLSDETPLYAHPSPTPAADADRVRWMDPDAVPQVKAGREEYRIVAVRRAHDGNVYRFPATYLNQVPLTFEDEGYTPRPVTGWFSAVTGEDGDGSLYHELLGADDELLAWCDLPSVPTAESLAALKSEGK